MKRITTLFAVIFIVLFASLSFGQTIKTDVYTNYGYGIDSSKFTTPSFDFKGIDKGQSKFNVKDVFLGVDYGLTDNFSANAKLRYNTAVDLYTASINYKTNVSKDLDLNLSLGQTESFWYNYTAGLFNNYAIDNVLSEKFKLTDRTQTGLKAMLVNKNITGSFEVSNGVNTKNKAFKFSAFVSPVENFKLGAFFNNDKFNNDTLDFSYNTFGGNAFYKFTTKKLGSLNLYGEYIQISPSLENGKKIEGFTVFTEYFFNESPFSLLAKFDNYNDLNNKNHEQYITGGINYQPNQMYKFGLNWRNVNNLAYSKAHNEVYFTAGFSF